MDAPPRICQIDLTEEERDAIVIALRGRIGHIRGEMYFGRLDPKDPIFVEQLRVLDNLIRRFEEGDYK